ncbi:MAG: DUF5688 family protein [Eubacterium sp.]|nr:DUF5688 family protein [Eubacterium sp.]
MMNKATFKDVIIEEIRRAVPSSYDVSTREVVKSNDAVYTGITITPPNSNVGATVYVEHMYEDYKSGIAPEVIAEKTVSIVMDEGQISVPDFDKAFILDNVYYRMANAEANQRRFESVPVINPAGAEDIALYPAIDVTVAGRAGVIVIQNSHLEGADISLDELHTAAQRNTESRVQITKLSEVLAGITGMPEEAFDSPLYVTTDKKTGIGTGDVSLFGAPSILADLPTMYILPSSVHELLLIPESQVESPEHLANLVAEVNVYVVEREDVLSGNIYKVEDGKIQTALVGLEVEASNEYENE